MADHPDRTAVTALQRAFPLELPDLLAASDWFDRRRSTLLARSGSRDDAHAVSSGCAASGAARHRAEQAEQAGAALSRLVQGRLAECVRCGARLTFERLDALPTAVACAPCQQAVAGPPDTKWCR